MPELRSRCCQKRARFKPCSDVCTVDRAVLLACVTSNQQGEACTGAGTRSLYAQKRRKAHRTPCMRPTTKAQRRSGGERCRVARERAGQRRHQHPSHCLGLLAVIKTPAITWKRGELELYINYTRSTFPSGLEARREPTRYKMRRVSLIKLWVLVISRSHALTMFYVQRAQRLMDVFAIIQHAQHRQGCPALRVAARIFAPAPALTQSSFPPPLSSHQTPPALNTAQTRLSARQSCRCQRHRAPSRT